MVVVAVVAVLTHWRGHIESISCLELVEDTKMILTSSSDCTVRMWTLNGEYVGKKTSLTRSILVHCYQEDFPTHA